MVPWELVVLFSFAVLLSLGCSLDMTLDEDSLLPLGCSYNISMYILHSYFYDFPYAGGHHHTTNI
jgi:hypothetical protein